MILLLIMVDNYITLYSYTRYIHIVVIVGACRRGQRGQRGTPLRGGETFCEYLVWFEFNIKMPHTSYSSDVIMMILG